MGLIFSSEPSWTPAGKHVLITGASSGIGAELARHYAKTGANLALLSRSKANLQKIADECLALGAERVEIYPCNLTQNDTIQDATQKATETFGRFDVLILNAGRSMGCYFEEIRDVNQIDYMMSVNVGGVLHVTHHLLPSVPKVASSRIVIVSSVSGKIGVPYRTVYCASKHALTGFANALRMELRDVYGMNAPAVCLIDFPEVAGTKLNKGRMDFGADRSPAYFDERGVASVEEACRGCAEAVARGEREWGSPLKMRLLLPLYSLIPDALDRIIVKIVKKTHFRDDCRLSDK